MFARLYEKTKLLDIACNAVLVDHGIRPAFLIQPVDYGENMQDCGPKTDQIIKSICEEERFNIFPTYAGLIVTKEDIKIPADLNDVIIGEIIGYPCAGDLDIEERRKFGYNICVWLDIEKSTIMGVICGQDMDDWFEKKVEEIEELFLELNLDIDVDYEKINIFSNKKIIEKIKAEIELHEEEKNHVINECWNYGFYIVQHWQYEKKIDIFKFPNLVLSLLNNMQIICEKSDKEVISYQRDILKSCFNAFIDDDTIKQLYFKYDHGKNVEI